MVSSNSIMSSVMLLNYFKKNPRKWSSCRVYVFVCVPERFLLIWVMNQCLWVQYGFFIFQKVLLC